MIGWSQIRDPLRSKSPKSKTRQKWRVKPKGEKHGKKGALLNRAGRRSAASIPNDEPRTTGYDNRLDVSQSKCANSHLSAEKQQCILTIPHDTSLLQYKKEKNIMKQEAKCMEREFLKKRITDMLEDADDRQLDLIFRFARGLLK